ncbi:hypothetical protein EHS13_13925 [Paenibacillus psychroresistens]|uniref:Uncharacterized protein n=1 Tax=Paenibacillus psychroresistens TaxID=1778678 RepID=A0A6B8RJV3_9BACL|nr:hypothetical protein [Paenibacillus psychroresistens]QGQ95895.1 hypothetical protein EHS13_13925 [Paenibacillus psychroresistens]
MIDQIKQIISFYKANPITDSKVAKDVNMLISYIEHLEGSKIDCKQILYLIEQGEREEFARTTTDLVEAKKAKWNGKKVIAYDGVYVTKF